MRTYISDIVKKEGETVSLSGWVSVRRDHGKLIFIDLRDMTGSVQVVFTPKAEEAHRIANTIRPEWVVKIEGEVKKRPDSMVNKDSETGSFEVSASSIEVLNEANTPPIDVLGDGLDIGEESRMKYRYIDLRRERLQKNLRMRFRVLKEIRDYLAKEKFTEIETPILSKSTPEGARDYLVPSRLHRSKFYALPQAPQQYKQLLMASSFERYFQIARCFRDEDTRGDRQPEFTQMDLEMSFVERDDVMALNEALLIHIVSTLYPEKKIQEVPFPVITYKEAMEKYGSDRPDLRKDKDDPNLLAFVWVVDFPFFEKSDKGGWTFTHNPFSAARPQFTKDLLEKNNIENILTTQYDVALNGLEIGGGSIRNHDPKLLKSVLEIIGVSEESMERDFSHMFEALASGAPPHGGIAWGFDRLMMVLQNEPNIREIMAFPKTGDGRDLLMESPSSIDPEQLIDLGIKLIKEE